MSSMTEPTNVKLLVDWLGVDGAAAGLKNSKKCTIDVLTRLAVAYGIEVESRPKRNELIEDIIRVASKRIDKPIEALASMDQPELLKYFEQVEVEPHELLDLLKRLDLNPGREGRRNLMEFVARELSETGRFMRIASKGKSD